MAHMVICPICGQKFDRDTIQSVKYGKRRYAHQTCYPEGELVPMPPKKMKAKEEKEEENLDRQQLLDYICELFGWEKVTAAVMITINQYIKKGYSYKEILMALTYFYDVRGNSIAKANNNIRIFEYVIDDAKRYYIELMQTKERNKNLTKDELDFPVKEIHVRKPQCNPMTKLKKLFSFLNQEEE